MWGTDAGDRRREQAAAPAVAVARAALEMARMPSKGGDRRREQAAVPVAVVVQAAREMARMPSKRTVTTSTSSACPSLAHVVVFTLLRAHEHLCELTLRCGSHLNRRSLLAFKYSIN